MKKIGSIIFVLTLIFTMTAVSGNVVYNFVKPYKNEARFYSNNYVTPVPTPTKTPTPTISIKPSDNTSSIVYITNTGTKYHRAGCSYLSKSSIKIDKSKAIKEGYTACSKCKP